MKYIKWKLKGDGKCRLAQASPTACRWQWRHCLGRTPVPPQGDRREPGKAVTHLTGPRSCKCSCPRDSAGTPALTRAGEELQIQSSTLNWSHPCNSAALLYTRLHSGKKTHLHCCFLFCLLTHFFKYFYQTLFWYLGQPNKMWINTLWEMLSIKQLNHNSISYKRFLMELYNSL